MIIDRSKQQKNLLEMLQEKMNTSVRHAMAMEPAENVLCSTKTWRNRTDKAGQRSFFGKTIEDGYRLACQSYPAGAYEVELPESEETIEVLSEWGSSRKWTQKDLQK